MDPIAAVVVAERVSQLVLFLRAARGRTLEFIAAVVILVFLLALGWAVTWFVGVSLPDYATQAIPTFFAVLASIPFAIWGFRVEADARKAEEAQSTDTRRRVVLGIIRRELSEARDEMLGDRAEEPRPPFVIPFLKLEAWRALADGGELRWVDDPELIGEVVRAYHRIQTTTELERSLYETSVHGLTSNDTPLSRTFQARYATLVDQDKHTVAAIDVALARIDKSLAANKVH